MRNVGGTLDFLKNLPPPQEPRFWQSPAGYRLAWNEFGDPAGRPVLYCHGWPSSRMQAVLVHHLARERGLRVIAPDRPGMGLSEHVPGRTLASWPETMAA
ncbi:MAG TPA: alpha/beta hydrolase, partial [Luteolibacter sp.]|nr:alpha/beta hydrolase [Luteolibacter sp.]